MSWRFSPAFRLPQYAALAEETKLGSAQDCAAENYLELLLYLRCVISHVLPWCSP